jgi:tetratricopeptide (TPR) repeat protein
MRFSVLLLCSAVFFSAAFPVMAGSQRDRDDCNQSNDQNRRIEGCTRLLEDKEESPSNRAVAYNNRGLAFQAKGDNDRAFTDYNEAIRLDPKYPAAYFNRGAVYQARGDGDLASRDYSEANRLEPK